MKKITCWSGYGKFPGLKKLIRIMKLTTFLILLSIGCVFAGKTYSQTKLLNLMVDNATVKEVLSEIEDQSEFYFMYSGKLIDVDREVSVSIENKKIDEVLNLLFASTDVKYVVKDRFIVLTKEGNDNEFTSALQQKSITGTVTDENGGPLPGVTVIIKGTTTGTVTNANGEFQINNVSPDASLQFSFVGMKTQEIQVGNQTVISIIMVPDAIGIEEVVAIGYGTMKKSDLTGSVVSVSSEDLKDLSNTNVLDQVQGRLAGVSIINKSAAPGANPEILIRGINSITASNSPLIVLDGIPFNGSISSINPGDIETFNVLKDASSTAIYGTRGSNGVIIITTKKRTNKSS
jgi:TonB-dependent SusC/RagA subfamily outer membrane receptor